MLTRPLLFSDVFAMPDSKRLEFPCTVAAGREASRTLKDFLAQRKVDEDVLFACELALTEALNNAVQHYRPSSARSDLPSSTANTDPRTCHAGAPPIAAEAIVTGNTIELRVTDHTLGFDHPGQIAAPIVETTTGRGLYIIQSMMDSVRYERDKDHNVLIMIKRLP